MFPFRYFHPLQSAQNAARGVRSGPPCKNCGRPSSAVSLEKSHLRSQAGALQYEVDNGHIPEARLELLRNDERSRK
jgi:hypothetical protein